jgi:hypothetical protein
MHPTRQTRGVARYTGSWVHWFGCLVEERDDGTGAGREDGSQRDPDARACRGLVAAGRILLERAPVPFCR